MATRGTSKKPPAKAPAKKAPPKKGGAMRCPDCGGPIKNGVCQTCGYAVK